jgi:hypothetical protein
MGSLEQTQDNQAVFNDIKADGFRLSLRIGLGLSVCLKWGSEVSLNRKLFDGITMLNDAGQG